MSGLLKEQDRVEYEYLMEHLAYVGELHGANRIDFNMHVDDDRPRYQVYMMMGDGSEYQFQAYTMKEFMYKVYGENEVPNL